MTAGWARCSRRCGTRTASSAVSARPGSSCRRPRSSPSTPTPASSRSAKRYRATSAAALATRASSMASCWPPNATASAEQGATMTAIATERYTGASIKRSEDPRILTGAGRYVDDIKLPGMLHAAFVRSPLAHGRVLAVDASAARALPVIVAVLTGADLDEITVRGPDPLLAFLGGGPAADYSLLATDRVRLVGDPVAVVIAENRYLAEDGCELVDVDYADLPAVASARAALDPGSTPVFANLGNNIIGPHKRSEFGDVAGTFAAADRMAEFHLDVHRHQNVPMEGRGCVASYDTGPGVLTMHAATQSVHI